ncbi:MAG: hypothetical protein QOF14_3712 [Hyphomicrobiales bacterium]|jgi:hypothetical protein|nr:hypothetical protein [Hyphomicrobiales bacterium]
MRKEVRVGQTKISPLRYSRHVQFGARIFFNDSGYQSHTVVCWFERDRENKDRFVFRTRRRGAEMPPQEWLRHYTRARQLLIRHGLNPDTATYADLVELAKSFERRPRRSEEQQPSLAD